MNKGALEGVTVLDMTRVLSGPYCGMILGDMGANVIKIEVPKTGDDSRAFPPFVGDESAYFMNLNRNKRGVTLNLKKNEAKQIFLEMVKKADVLIENFRPGTMEKLGLGWEALKEVNPSLIYGCISGFGHYGPYSSRAGYDIVGQAMSGVMSVTGWADGEPTRTGAPIADMSAGLSLATGILAALHYKEKTGKGQKVDIALVDSLVTMMTIISQIYLVGGRLPQRIGNRYESTAPYDSFPTKDGQNIVIGCANDKFWSILCKLMNREDLVNHPDMVTNKKRVENHAKIKPIVVEWTLQYNSKDLVQLLLDHEVPAAPIYDVAQVAADEHIAGAREMFVKANYPQAGELTITNSHFKMSETQPGFHFPSPNLGEHNLEVFGELLGYDEEKIKELAADSVI